MDTGRQRIELIPRCGVVGIPFWENAICATTSIWRFLLNNHHYYHYHQHDCELKLMVSTAVFTAFSCFHLLKTSSIIPFTSIHFYLK